MLVPKIVIITAQNTKISPNFLVWKLCITTKFPHQGIRSNYDILHSVAALAKIIIKLEDEKKPAEVYRHCEGHRNNVSNQPAHH